MNGRQTSILELLRSAGPQTVRALAERFGVTPVTIRRDLDLMAREGRLQRSHGAVALSAAGAFEFAFQGRVRRHAPQKRALARAIAACVQPGMVVALDTGTTALAVAQALAHLPRLTVLTTSLPVASVLHAHDQLEVLLMGGAMRRNVPDLSGPLTEQNLRSFHTHLAVLGADAATPEGVFSTDMGASRSTQAMMAGAEMRFLALDSSKFAARALYRYALWSEFHKVFTDDGAKPEVRAWLDTAGPPVQYVPVERGEE